MNVHVRLYTSQKEAPEKNVTRTRARRREHWPHKLRVDTRSFRAIVHVVLRVHGSAARLPWHTTDRQHDWTLFADKELSFIMRRSAPPIMKR